MNQKKLYIVLIIIVFLFLFVKIAFKLFKLFQKAKWKAVAVLFLLFLMPVGCNAVLLVATEADTSLQMTVPLAFFLPLFLDLTQDKEPNTRKFKGVQGIQAALAVLLLYGCVLQTQVDQEAMRAGMLSVSSMARTVVQDLKEQEHFGDGLPVCIAGVPSENRLYYFPKACEGANLYAIFGAWGSWSNASSWKGVFHNLLGVNMEFVSTAQYYEITQKPDLQSMPSFPEEGYIAEYDGVIVVKISEAY